jgi:hypothetical protein
MSAWNYPAPPKRLRILSRTFRVRPISAEERENGHEASWAFINGHTGEIALDPDLQPDAALEALLHEIAHAVWQAFLRNQEAACEEHVVIAMGQGLAAVLQQNPKLRAWIDEVAR